MGNTLKNDTRSHWNEFINEFSSLTPFSSRQVAPNKLVSHSIHILCDASEAVVVLVMYFHGFVSRLINRLHLFQSHSHSVHYNVTDVSSRRFLPTDLLFNELSCTGPYWLKLLKQLKIRCGYCYLRNSRNPILLSSAHCFTHVLNEYTHKFTFVMCFPVYKHFNILPYKNTEISKKCLRLFKLNRASH